MRKIAKRICAMILATTMLTSMFSLSSISAFAKETEVQTQAEVQTEAEDIEPDNQLGEFEIPSGKTGDLTFVEEKEYEGSVDVINTPAEYYKAINKGSNLIRNVSNLPDSIDNSKTKYFPPIGDQNPLGACTAWANVYYQFSYEINRKLDRTATSENSFSPKFAYNLINNGEDDGAGSYTTYDVLSEYGAPSLESVPYDYDYLTWSFDEDVWKEASQYKLKSYQVINIPNTGVDITSPDDSDLTTIKTAIANGDVLTFSTYVRSWTYRNLKINPEAPENSKISNCPMVSEMSGDEGAHRMTIVGYNDDIWIDINSNDKIDDGEMGAFKVANSWGTNETFSGYYYVAYDALNRFSSVRGYKNPAERRPIFESISRIDVEATNPVSDFSLRYTVNSATRIKSEIKIVAERFGTKTEVKLPPYSHLKIHWDTVDHSYDGTDTASDATFYANLSDYIPEVNSDNISEYSISVLFSDTEADSKSLTVKNVELIDNRNNKIYRPSNFSTFKLDGAEKSVNILKSTERAAVIYYKGYHNPKIEYKTENGSWTPAPGKAMEVYIEKSGYTHKYAVKLDDAEDFVYVRFNDGKGVYDNNNGSYYTAYAGENYFTTAGIKQPEIDINILTDMPSNRIMPAFQLATFTIDANGGYGTYTYTYNYKCISGNYEYTLSDREFNFHMTSFYEEGDYVFTVTVEDAVGNKGTATYEYTVKKLDPEFEYFISRSDGNVYVGELVHFFALLNPVESPEYKFEIYNFNFGYFEKGSEVENYHHDNGKRYLHSTWTPQATGTYYIYLTVKDSRGKTKTETLVLNVSLPPLQIESIDLSKEDVAYYGDIIDINVEAKGGTGEIEYKILCLNRGTENVLQDYSSNKTVSYDIGFWGGDCIFSVIARDSVGNVAMAEKELAVIAPVFEITSFSKDSATTNETITINSKLNNISQSLDPSRLIYTYYIQKDGVNEEVIDTSDLTLSWTPKKVGKYTIIVNALYYVTVNGGFVLDTAEYEYEVVYKDLTLESFEVSPDGKGGFFEIVNMTANAIGGTGELEYQFYYTKYGQKYILQDYSTKNTASYQFGIDMGDYPLSVSVRDSLGNVVTSKQIEYTVVQTYITELSLSNSSVRTNEKVVITPTIRNDSSVLKAEHYKYTVTKDGVTETLTTSADETATWIPKETGTYKIQLEIRYNGTLVSILSRNFVVNDIGIGIESFELSPKDKGGAFEILNMTANAKGGTGKLEYQFYYVRYGQEHIIQDYSTKNTATYQFMDGPSGLAYSIYVRVRDASGYVVTSQEKKFTVLQTYISEFTFDKATANVGETVVITPVIKNDSSVLKAEHYKYTVTKDGVTETLTTSADETASWTPKKSGTYEIKLEIRYKDTLVAILTCDYEVRHKDITIESFEHSPEDKGGFFEILNMTATAKGGTGKLEYQFFYTRNGQKHIVQDYSTKNTASYQFGIDMGDYPFSVSVRDEEGYVVTSEQKEFTVVQTYITNFIFSNDSAGIGETVVITPVIKNDSSVLKAEHYKYTVTKDGVTETLTTSADETASWTPKETGTYEIKLEIRYNDTLVSIDSCKYVVDRVGIVIDNFTVTPDSNLGMYEKINVSANATGGIGTLEYQFVYAKNSIEYIIQDYSSKNTATAQLNDTGYYTIAVNIKDSKGNIVKTEKQIYVNYPYISDFSYNTTSAKAGETVIVTPNVKYNPSVLTADDYVYTVTKNGVTETIKASADKTLNWTPKEAGDYTIKLELYYGDSYITSLTRNYTVAEAPVKENNIYLIPSSEWKQANARFAMYMWGDNVDGKFVSMTANSAGIYSAPLADGYDKVIFVRMNPATTENNWSNKWNQSVDLTVQSGKNCFTVNSGEWEGANGTWSVYFDVDPTEPNTTVPPTTVPVTTAPVTTQPITTIPVTTVPPTTSPVVDDNIYFIPSNNWKESNARFAVYAWGDNVSGTFVSMTENSDGVYSAKLADGCNKVIFVRMNPATTDNNWSNKWNQTADLTVQSGKNCFTVNSGEWEGANGTWSVYSVVDPTEPTTTVPVTTVPTTTPTLPVDEVSVFGDINLLLEETEANIYTGSVELQAGTYKFNLNNKGTTHGTNYTYTDTATIDYSAGYKAQTTLKVSGGRYTFTFNASTKKLTIKFKSFEDIVELVGDINAELVRPNKNTTVFTGTIRLEAGTYKFNVNEHGELFGLNNKFTDSIYNIPFIYKSEATFVATGGVYSVRYDTSNNQLKVLQAPAGLGDVTIFGDISLPLASQGNGVYSAQTILDAGSYDIRVDSFGTFFGNGTEFTNTVNVEFKTEWKAAATLKVSEKMKFTFIFDSNTNKVKVFNAPIDTTKVKVAFDDIDTLVLTSVDGVTYTATTTLDAGTYTFRMDEFGTPMGGKYTFTDSTSNLLYNASYASATTMIAIGGEYKFSYNVNTNQLTVFRYNNEGKVSIYGDIELDLNSLSGGRYIGSVELTSGTYTFRINDFGTPMCYDGTFTDTIPNSVFTSDCRKSTTFIVTGGKYSFYYDQVTNVVSVSKS